MSFRLSPGLRLRYEVDGPPNAPALVLANSIGTSLGLWDAQVAALAPHLHVIRYDARGHGQSEVPNGDYSLDQLGTDLVCLLDELRLASAHVCGISLGGLTAQWVALTHPERVQRLVLANTAARIGTAEGWTARIDLVRSGGMAAVHEVALARFFSARLRAENMEVVDRVGAMLDATSVMGYVGCCAALRDADLRDVVHSIRASTLVIAGGLDVSTPVSDAEYLKARIPTSDLVVLEQAGHLSNLEMPEVFSQEVLTFLMRPS